MGCQVKPALLAPIGLMVLSALGVVSGALAAPRRFHAVEVSARVVGADVGATESASDGEARHLVAFARMRSVGSTPLLPKTWTCGAVEASAVGGSYKRCEVQ